MAGQVRGWAVASLIFATALSAQAQSTTDTAPLPPNPPGLSNSPGTAAPGQGGPGEKWREWRAQHPGGMGQGGGQAFENVRKAIEALTPEQRQRFQENFQRWMNLSPEEKKALREREDVRRKTIEEEIQAAIQESGLQLDGERREQFVKRYSDERRTIEEQLHKEMAEKRRPLVKQLVARLRAEFAAQGAPASSSVPLPAPSSQTTIRTSSPETPKP
jgi:hypothetical protein